MLSLTSLVRVPRRVGRNPWKLLIAKHCCCETQVLCGDCGDLGTEDLTVELSSTCGPYNGVFTLAWDSMAGAFDSGFQDVGGGFSVRAVFASCLLSLFLKGPGDCDFEVGINFADVLVYCDPFEATAESCNEVGDPFCAECDPFCVTATLTR